MAQGEGEDKHSGGRGDPRSRQEGERIKALIEAGAATPMADLEREAKSLANEDRRQDIRLKKRYANWMLGGMGVQLLLANGIFMTYGFFAGWQEVPGGVMQAWLAATVVQLVGVVYVITSYLFPTRDQS